MPAEEWKSQSCAVPNRDGGHRNRTTRSRVRAPRSRRAFRCGPCTSGSAASAAIARPTNKGDCDCRKFGSFLPASRQLSSVTPRCCSMDSDRRKPGVTAMTVMPCGASSAAQSSGSTFCAILTACAIGLPPPPIMSFSVTSTMRPRFAGIIASAACFAVMIRDVRPCRKIAPAVFGRPARGSVRAHQRILARHAVDDDVDALVSVPDAPEQRLHLRLVGVIDANGNGPTAGGL